MANDRFTDTGWRRVRDMVGEGKLRGRLLVDQVYAKYQHERLDLRHPRGGGPEYLRRPLMENHSKYLQRLADSVLDGTLEQTMADVVESLNGAMSSAAPVMYNNLRRSGHPQVYSQGTLIYNRPPWQRRLSRDELRILRRRRGRR